MRKHENSIYVLIGVLILVIVCGFAAEGMSQVPFYPPPYIGWGFNPFLNPFAIAPIGSYFPLLSSPQIPLYSAPAVSPFSRIGAATIIVTNPTAGTVSVINPTVATTPTVTTASPPPLLSLLATVYASALYEGALSTANPLLFALLQNLFL
jgi:hypothetical protein